MCMCQARPHHMLETEEEVLDIVGDDPSTSTREIARQTLPATKLSLHHEIPSNADEDEKIHMYSASVLLWSSSRLSEIPWGVIMAYLDM
ncbi:hypothetical protein NQ317_000165, partial [Molorchus minor]